MTRTLGLCVVIFILLTVGSSGSSQSASEATAGNGLLGSCQISIKASEDGSYHEDIFDSWRDGFCVGLIAGVDSASHNVCPDPNVTNGQEKRVVLKYLQDHPEELHLDAAKLVERALAKAFPCAKK